MVDKRTPTIQPALNQDAAPSQPDPVAPGEVRDQTMQNAANNPNVPGEVRLDPNRANQQNQPGQPNQQDNKRLVSIDKSRINSEIDAWVNFAQQTELKDGQEHVLKITAGLDGSFNVDRSIMQKPV